MKFTSLYNQTISAGLYKSSYFMNKRILYKPLVSRFSYFLCCYCHKNSVNILHFQHQFFKHLIINKWARVLIFLFWVSWSSYLQHISTTSLKIVYEKWLITVGKCALFPGRCHIHITFFQLKQIHPHHTCDLIQKSSKKSVILIRLPLIS
jgi:hypothetical protein